MMDFGNFTLLSFEAERRATNTKVLVHKYLGGATAPVEIRLPDRFEERPIKVKALDRDTHELIGEREASEKVFDWEKGQHFHGGTVKVRQGDYIVCEDGAFFAVPATLFSELFRKV